MTNVPGPRQPLYLAGAPVRQMMFWVPQSGDIGVGVSILSYDGTVQFGLITDKNICKDPQAVIARFRPEFENLVHAVLLMPWDEEADPEIATRALHATEALANAADHLLQGVGNGEPGQGADAPASAAAPAATDPASDADAGKAAARPAGLRTRRKSAFAAARAAG
jgi:hypothetical protein